MKHTTPFIKILFAVLGASVIFSLVDDDLFLQSGSRPSSASIQKPNVTISSSPRNASRFWGGDDWVDWSNRWWWGEGDGDDVSSNSSTKAKSSFLSTWSSATRLEYKPRVSIVVDAENDQAEDYLSRLAFAKMLQVEAHRSYGIETELVIVMPSAPSSHDCFPIIQNTTQLLLSDDGKNELELRQIEQEQWLGSDKTLLLVASPDGLWQDGLYVIQQQYRSEAARYAGAISVPFIRISKHLTPPLSEWKHARDIAAFMEMAQQCCAMKMVLPEESAIVHLESTNMQDESFIDRTQLLQILHRPPGSNVVLVGKMDATLEQYYEKTLREERNWTVKVVRTTSEATSLFCVLRNTSYAEFIGSLDSPLDVLAAVLHGNVGKSSVRLFGRDTVIVKHEQAITHPINSRQSNIHVEVLPSPSSAARSKTELTSGNHLLGSQENPVTLLVQVSGPEHLSRIAEGLAVQFVLEQKYNVTSTIVLRPRQDWWIENANRLKECYPRLASLSFDEANTQAFDVRHHEMQTLGLAGLFDLSGVLLAEQLEAIQQTLKNTTRMIHNATLTVKEVDAKKWSMPFIFMNNTHVNVDVQPDFRDKFDRLFAQANTTSNACISMAQPESVWTRLVGSKENRDRAEEISLVIFLSGELGNQLSKLAHGFGISWILEEDYNIKTRIMLRHQEATKWKRARQSVITCFPKFRTFDFAEANTQEFDERFSERRTWLGNDAMLHFVVDQTSEESIRAQLDTLPSILANSTRPQTPFGSKITMPFVSTDVYGNFGYINDRFYERLKDLFQYDYLNPLCCSNYSQPDEIVLHIRGFLGEMPRKAVHFGFEELSPNKTLNELLANQRKGDKVAILGRFESQIAPYIDVLNQAGLQARFVETSNGEQSFCYLLSAKTFIGIAQSTFAIWVAYLGNATTVRLYSIMSPARIARLGTFDNVFVRQNYTNPTLREKISFELYRSEEQEAVDRGKRHLLQNTRN